MNHRTSNVFRRLSDKAASLAPFLLLPISVSQTATIDMVRPRIRTLWHIGSPSPYKKESPRVICSNADTSQLVLLKELKNDMLSNHYNLHDEFTDMPQ